MADDGNSKSEQESLTRVAGESTESAAEGEAEYIAPREQEISSQNSQISVSSMWRAPIPPPNLMAEYEGILSGSADRILKMAEYQQSSVHDSKRREDRSVMWGQIFLFLLCATALLIGFYALTQGHLKSASILVIVPLACVTAISLITRRK